MLRRLSLLWCLAGALAGCQGPTGTAEAAKDPPPVARAPAPRVTPEPPAPVPPRRRVLQVGPPPSPARLSHPAALQPLQAYPLARPSRALPSRTPQAAVYAPPSPTRHPSAPNDGLPPGWTSHSTLAPSPQVSAGFSQVQQQMVEQRRRIQAQNALLIQQSLRPPCPPPLPSCGGVNDTRATYPQAAYPRGGFPQQGNPRKEAERRYLEARADFMNTKYLPAGSPPRWSADSLRGEVGTGMPLPPEMMTRDAMFNPVLQKAQHAEVLRQQMMRIPSYP